MSGRYRATGCLAVLIGLNALLMTPLAAMLATGPFSSARQMWWYRGASLTFLTAGAIAPGLAIALGAHRSALAVKVIAIWCPGVLLWTGWILRLGGGV